VGAIADLFVGQLPLDYYRTLPAEMNAVSSEDVQRVAQKYLDPDQMVVIAAGDRSKIEAGLKALGAGPVEVVP